MAGRPACNVQLRPWLDVRWVGERWAEREREKKKAQHSESKGG